MVLNMIHGMLPFESISSELCSIGSARVATKLLECLTYRENCPLGNIIMQKSQILFFRSKVGDALAACPRVAPNSQAKR